MKRIGRKLQQSLSRMPHLDAGVSEVFVHVAFKPALQHMHPGLLIPCTTCLCHAIYAVTTAKFGLQGQTVHSCQTAQSVYYSVKYR